MNVEQACPNFFAVQATSAKFGLYMGNMKCNTQRMQCISILIMILSRARDSVTNNNGFLDWTIGLIGAAITITLNYNHFITTHSR
jgi:hypothetical protein